MKINFGIFPMLLFFVFLILKLANIGIVATWSWWWVTSPLWIMGVIAIIMLIIWFVICMLSD